MSNKFDCFYNYLKNDVGFENLTLKEICQRMYNQGYSDNDEGGKEIPIEEISREIEANLFIEQIQEFLNNPEEHKDFLESTPYVRVVFPCTQRDKCVAFPDRCSDVGAIDPGIKCSKLVNLSKLCGVEENEGKLKEDTSKLLTPEEIEVLASIIGKLKGNK